MFSGIASGFLSVLFMCVSYIFSREYLRKYKDPVKLSIFSQLIMAIAGIVMLVCSSFLIEFPFSCKFFLLLAGQTSTFLLGQTSFFLLLKEVEASRASSLIGLKLIALAALSVIAGRSLSAIQWLAVLLCTVSAAGMNFSGGKISLRSCFWLLSASFSYAACDMCVTELMQIMPATGMMLKAVAVMGWCFSLLGIMALPGLIKYPFNKAEFTGSIPYSTVYLCSMLFLYASFGISGVVFGSIIQASRGIFSIVLGIILLRFGLERNEPHVPGKVWIRRLIMAVMMLSAIILYTLSVTNAGGSR